MSSLLIQSVISIASAEVGVRETSGNMGKRVEEYQRADTLPGVGYAWCASFCSWLLKQAGARHKCDIEYCYSASCDVVLAWARSEGVLRDTPQVGDFGLCMASKYDATHIFLVVAVDGDWITTIEGNTNLSGAREGIGVFRRRRQLSLRYKFVRWIEAQPQSFLSDQLSWKAVIGTHEIALIKRAASFYAPARAWGEALGFVVTWNSETQSVAFNEREVPSQVAIINGSAYVPVRVLAEFSGLDLTLDDSAKRIKVTK